MKDTSDQSDLFWREWEERADKLLGTTQYDPELGKRVARDAIRVVAGDLSKAEFHQKYHQAYLQEFGGDNRVRESGENSDDTSSGVPRVDPGEPCPKPPAPEPLPRRAFLKLTGGSLAAVAMTTSLGRVIQGVGAGGPQGDGGSSQAQGIGEQSQQARPVQMGMVIDLERCTGCLACVDACHRENNTSPGVHWIYVFAYEDENQEGLNFLVRPCQHCSNPPCVKVCPVAARHKRKKDGLVLTDYDICIGCRYCEVACPYGVNFFQWGDPRPDEGFRYQRTDYRGRKVNGNPPKGVIGKCTFCPQRQDSEWKTGTASCQLACPHDAIFFGDMNDPNSPPRRYLKKKAKENGGSISTFRLLEDLGTKPNILYIGHQPSRHARQADGPTRYEDYDIVDERRTILEGPRPWFSNIFGGE